LLITDLEEACRLSGEEDIKDAIEFFRRKGTGALIVTTGAGKVKLFSQGSLFKKVDYDEMPISNAVVKDLQNGKGKNGDTTGCGDNFVGGAIASVISQLQESSSLPDIKEAVALGVVSGGITTFCMGGVLIEKRPGEKKEIVDFYKNLYKDQLS